MFKVTADESLISISKHEEWDGTLGHNIMCIEVGPGPMLTSLQTEMTSMKFQLEAMTFEQETEALLRKQNPALQELYDQYRVVYTLVKKADKVISESNA